MVSDYMIRRLQKKIMIIEGCTFVLLTFVFMTLLQSTKKLTPWIQLSYDTTVPCKGQLSRTSRSLLDIPLPNNTSLMQSPNNFINLVEIDNQSTKNESFTNISTERELETLKSDSVLNTTNATIEYQTITASFSLYILHLSLQRFDISPETFSIKKLGKNKLFTDVSSKNESLSQVFRDLQGVSLTMYNFIISSLYTLFLCQAVLLIHFVRLFSKAVCCKDNSLNASLLPAQRKKRPSLVPLGLVTALCFLAGSMIFYVLYQWYYRYLSDAYAIFYAIVSYLYNCNMQDIQNNTQLYLLKGYFFVLFSFIIVTFTALVILLQLASYSTLSNVTTSSRSDISS
jgi:hypothetical protein